MRGVFLLFVLGTLYGCNKPYDSDCSTNPGLFDAVNFNIGVAVSLTELENNTGYATIVKQQFNQITPENAFKPERLQPQEGTFSFEEAKQLLAWAANEGKEVHGHCLVWHNQLPAWMQNFEGDRQAWIALMKNHISTVVAELGSVKSWDVVNEAFEDDGSFRESIWYRHIGPEYIEMAFEFAHEANSDALLFYNDYNLASKPKKLDAVLAHLRQLVNKGVAVHGIGLQLHINIKSPGKGALEKAVEGCIGSGLRIHFSEIDISVNPSGGALGHLENKLNKQAQTVEQLTQIYLSIPPAQQFAMSFWGVSDANSWIPAYYGREDYPLLFDQNYRAKPAYCALRSALGQ
ncbi:endo-1,4-beta-xylanase [bacterium]|nr:endo-1,4-beta-xylanase [bacterium]